MGAPISAVAVGVDGTQLVSAIFHGDLEDIGDESGDIAGGLIGIPVGKKAVDASAIGGLALNKITDAID